MEFWEGWKDGMELGGREGKGNMYIHCSSRKIA